MLLHRKPQLKLVLERVDGFDCSHVKGTFDYGLHPRRVFTYCADCKKFALLDWKDSYGRVLNRFWGTLPAIITASFAFVTIAFIIYAVSKLG
jgi:hypothetical protein